MTNCSRDAAVSGLMGDGSAWAAVARRPLPWDFLDERDATGRLYARGSINERSASAAVSFVRHRPEWPSTVQVVVQGKATLPLHTCASCEAGAVSPA